MRSVDNSTGTGMQSEAGGAVVSGNVPAARTEASAAREEYQFAELILRTPESPLSSQQIQQWAAELGVTPTALRILNARGYAAIEAIRDFLAPSLKNHLPDPNQILNIARATDVMLAAVESGELITVYNDFDVDGLSSGSQLVLYLAALGAKVQSYTPSRFTEGYGLVRPAVEKLARSGTKLLVTVDCGITNHNEIAEAKRLGLKVVVLDHHQPLGPPLGLPPADVVVNPAQEGCPFQPHKLAAAGLVWMLLIVLRQQAKLRFGDAAPLLPDPKDYLDLAALGTICDMVPLTGLNRVIAHRGIEAINRSNRVGLTALRNVCTGGTQRELTSGHIAFQIGPRINAAGRIGDAMDVLALLTTSDSIRAKSLAEAIDRMNEQRRSIEEKVRKSCIDRLQCSPMLVARPAFALFGEDFHLGVIGIVAQRLVEAYHRPAAVMAPGETTIRGAQVPVIKGSVRSIRGFNVAEVLQELSSFLLGHGGHAEAGGFTVTYEKLEAFQEAFVAAAERRLDGNLLRRKLLADVEISLREVDFDLVRDIQRLAPFGVGNPTPILVSRGATILSVTSLGNRHLRLRLSDGAIQTGAVAWSMQGHPLLRKGERVDVAYQPEINSYQGISSVQLNLKEAWRAA